MTKFATLAVAALAAMPQAFAIFACTGGVNYCAVDFFKAAPTIKDELKILQLIGQAIGNPAPGLAQNTPFLGSFLFGCEERDSDDKILVQGFCRGGCVNNGQGATCSTPASLILTKPR